MKEEGAADDGERWGKSPPLKAAVASDFSRFSWCSLLPRPRKREERRKRVIARQAAFAAFPTLLSPLLRISSTI